MGWDAIGSHRGLRRSPSAALNRDRVRPLRLMPLRQPCPIGPMSGRGWALVTGAARRIGRALALSAAGAGYDVIVHHRDSD